MIRHISVYKLKDPLQKEAMKQKLEDAGKNSMLIEHMEVGENITRLPDAKGPVFGDLVQILDFRNEEDCALWPKSMEHEQLVQETNDLQLICAIDYLRK